MVDVFCEDFLFRVWFLVITMFTIYNTLYARGIKFKFEHENNVFQTMFVSVLYISIDINIKFIPKLDTMDARYWFYQYISHV